MRYLFCALLLALPAQADDLPAYLDEFRPRAEAAGIAPATLDAVLPELDWLADTVRLDRNQSEFTRTIWEYLDLAVSDGRVRNGRAALAANAAALEAIEARFGVEKEIVAAIWGLESSFGAFMGDTSTLDAVATLAADGRRRDFFEAQLLAALTILEAGDVTAAAMRGSWAGAMGHTQFMPSSFLDHAVDFDGDGRRDVWGTDPVDALASTAAYLAFHGWETGQPWGMEVMLPEGFDYSEASSLVTKTPSEWTALGVQPVAGGTLPGETPISIRVPAGRAGAAFATWPNFMVLERYNTADAYVIGVGHLADRLAGGDPIQSGWPRGDRALGFDERVEMQRLLAAAGFDPQKFDGLVGPLTLDAIRRWQASEGLVPDGYMPPRMLERLRGG
ncbi:lytic murein transglycosylase [uncultured Jannaschia sp.]|uniref:lytic murein transglycosylase n=1 Tax=uncultured Jannaschia sp. TaxID=293347 RepID=UPI00261699EE|nr:lytic murein transglycosylase [uncultured Jannaschia sp.]